MASVSGAGAVDGADALAYSGKHDPRALLHGPMAVDASETGAAPAVRTSMACEKDHDVFALRERSFGNQYSHLYYNRLVCMRRSVLEAARKRWPEAEHVDEILKVEEGKTCFIIGTLYKDMTAKPNILEEVAREQYLPPPAIRAKYTEETDSTVLEDQSGRVGLCGHISVDLVVTGAVIAVRGQETASGDFAVDDFCFAGLPVQSPLVTELAVAPSAGGDPYIALISGLNIGSESTSDPACNPLLLEMFVDYVTGLLGGENDQEVASRIVRVVVAGNVLGNMGEKRDSRPKYLRGKEEAASVEAVSTLDSLLARLASSVPVDIMPGQHDPSNHTMPQQPMHPCMLPLCAKLATVDGVSNPLKMSVGPVKILGTSGQPVNDIFRFVSTEDRLTILASTLEMRHLAPTAPDTLPCYPFRDGDPFIIADCPHIYFAGNQPEYSTKMVTGSQSQQVRIICVPSFSATGTVVLVNLRTLTSTPMEFQVNLS